MARSRRKIIEIDPHFDREKPVWEQIGTTPDFETTPLERPATLRNRAQRLAAHQMLNDDEIALLQAHADGKPTPLALEMSADDAADLIAVNAGQPAPLDPSLKILRSAWHDLPRTPYGLTKGDHS